MSNTPSSAPLITRDFVTVPLGLTVCVLVTLAALWLVNHC
jgi:hypothetical protein